MDSNKAKMERSDAVSEPNAPANKPGLGTVVRSILAAAIGVQSNKNRKQDFEEGNPLAFIIGGFVFTLLFIATIATIVGFVLSRA